MTNFARHVRCSLIGENVRFYLQLLLSLSGDVHLNPGPVSPGVFLCGNCDEAVSDVNKAMYCDSCDEWIHVFCDHYLTEDKYDHLIQNPSSDPWFCSACIEVHSVNPTGCHHSTLQCVMS